MTRGPLRSEDDTPYIDLLVVMAMPKAVPSAEPLLFHCGGPGSDASCVLGRWDVGCAMWGLWSTCDVEYLAIGEDGEDRDIP